jgi:hypothetical protein
MDKVSESQLRLIMSDFVRLSNTVTCPECGNETKMIGETRDNGNWICPFCLTYFPIKQTPQITLGVPFTKLTDQLENKPQRGILLGVPPDTFPMELNTASPNYGFLVPSYSYKIKRKRNILLAVMDDFSRTGRDKGGVIWQFDLIWNERTREEYEELISFADNMAYHLPFNYTDVFRGTTHICYFDSDVSDAEPASFDNVNFSVRITE